MHESSRKVATVNIIDESHVHKGISTSWLESIPAAEEFAIRIHVSNDRGLDHCIDTDENSVIYWARRGDRANFSRMVSGDLPYDTDMVVTVEVPHEGSIVLATAYFGCEIADKEPFQPDWSIEDCQKWCQENPESFWATHALVAEE